jgi:hypothetical protein
MKRWIAWLLCLLLCCGALPVTAANEDQIFRISCSMYGDGAAGRGFCWFTEHSGNSDLLLQKEGTDPSDAKHYSGVCRAYRKKYSHQVAVTDLEPGTAYRYRVGDAQKNLWSDWCSFSTDDRDDSFSFIAVADVQADDMEDFLQAASTLREAQPTERTAVSPDTSLLSTVAAWHVNLTVGLCGMLVSYLQLLMQVIGQAAH